MNELTPPAVEWSQMAPELILVGTALALLVAGTLVKVRAASSLYTAITLGAAGAAMVTAIGLWGDVTGLEGQPRLAIAGALVIDGFSVFFTIVVCSAVALAALLADDYLRQEDVTGPDYHVLILLSATGGILMAKANDLLIVFLGLEVLSISLYVLAGYHRRRDQSLEAAIKYFVLGAFSSAFLLYGIALTYGATGSTNLTEVAFFLRSQTLTSGVLLGGLGLLTVGLGFKVAAVPFHMWTPDVYQGSPTPVTAFMAAAAKAAGFAALLRVLFSTFESNRLDWQPVIWVLAILSLLVGSFLAIAQTDIKRMLAYSSISHAGYVLVGLQAANDRGIAGSLFYLFAYTFMVMGSFAVVTVVGRRGDANHGLDAYRGLAARQPALALAFTVFLLAQAGVPLTTGFLAKFYVLSAAVERGSYALAIIAMLAAVVAAFFYLRLIVLMYMSSPVDAQRDPEGTTDADSSAPLSVPVGVALALGICVAVTVVGGIFAEPLLDLARHATLLRL